MSDPIQLYESTPVRVSHVELVAAVRSEAYTYVRRQPTDGGEDANLSPNLANRDLIGSSSDAHTRLTQSSSSNTIRRIGPNDPPTSEDFSHLSESEFETHPELERVLETRIRDDTSEHLRTKTYVIDRMLQPLYEARTALEMSRALIEAQRNLEACDALHTDSRISLTPIQHAKETLDTQLGHIPGNIVDPIEERVVVPTIFTRLWRNAIAPFTRRRSTRENNDDNDEDDEDDDDDDGTTGLGGMPTSGSFYSSPSSSTSSAAVAAGEPLQFRLLARITEKSRTALKIATEATSTGRLGFTVAGKYRNALGLGETYDFLYTHGVSAQGSDDNELRLGLNCPDVFSLGTTNSFHIFRHNISLAQSSVTQGMFGLRYDVSKIQHPQHRFSYELASRTLRPISQNVMGLLSHYTDAAKKAVRVGKVANVGVDSDEPPHVPHQFQEPSPYIRSLTEPYGPYEDSHSVKSAVRYAWLPQTTSPDAWRPTFSTELAGLGGDARYIKFEGGINKQVPITKETSSSPSSRFSFAFGAHGTYLHHLPTSDSKRLRPFLGDRTFIMQNLLMRGYSPAAIGPRDEQDNLGGELMGTVGLAAIYRLPKLEVDAHVFWNCASIIGIHTGTSTRPASPSSSSPTNSTFHPTLGCLPRSAPLSRHFDSFLQGSKQSIGIGVVMPLAGAGRFEFNFVKPLEQGRPAKLEFGLGTQWT